MVPSSGSTTQRSPLEPATSSPSSPRTASSGRRAASTSRIARSASRSASETRSVGVDFVSTSRTPRVVVVEQHGGRRARRRHRHVEQVVGLIAADGDRPTAAPARSGRPARAASPRRRGARRAGRRAAARRRRSPAGTDAAGWPVTLNMPYHGHPRDDRVERPQRAAAVELADAERRPGGPGREHDVGVVEDRVDARGHGRLGAPRPGDLPGRDERAEPRHRARARLQALGMLARPRRRRGCRAGSAPPGSATPSARSRSRARRPRGRASAAARPCACTAPRCSLPSRARTPERQAGRDRHPQPARLARGGRGEAAAARGRLEEQRGVGDAPGQRPVDAQAVPHLALGSQRDAVALGLDAEQPAEGGRDADRAAAVGAQADAHRARGHGGARPAARAARRVVQRPRVARRAEGQRLGEREDRQLGHVRLADDDRAGLAQRAHDVGVALAPARRATASPTP